MTKIECDDGYSGVGFNTGDTFAVLGSDNAYEVVLKVRSPARRRLWLYVIPA